MKKRRRLSMALPLGLALVPLPFLAAPAAHAQSGPVRGIASFCTRAVLQAAASTTNPAVTIGPITNGPALPGGMKDVVASAATPEYCAVTGSVVTNSASGKTANFLLELPANWNGKFLFSGCGGNCGIITQPAAEALQHGYAAAATDDGHTANATGNFDGSWAATAPGVLDGDALADYYYRAVHTVTVAAKQLTADFYSQVAGTVQTLARSYFQGCSDGGREGMVEVDRYPADFDGVIAGDPYFDIRGQNIASLQVSEVQLRSPSAIVPPALLNIVDKAVMAQCDATDGVQDGLIQNPGACRFNPQTDLPKCSGDTSSATCFTQDQLDSVSVYISAATTRSGQEIHPGYPVGDMNAAPGLSLAAYTAFPFTPTDFAAPEPWGNGTGPKGWLAGDGVFRYLVYANEPGYNSQTTLGLYFAREDAAGLLAQVEAGLNVIFADAITRAVGDPVDRSTFFHTVIPDATVQYIDSRTYAGDGDAPPLAASFLGQGRKLLMYHGFSDGWITPFTTVQYYRALAGLAGGYGRLQQGARLFMVPGMYHCRGGSGPNTFDTLTAMENWVEHGLAPEAITATKYVNDNPSQGVARTMPLCKFPEQARYNGSGNLNDAASWACDPNDTSLLTIGPDGIQSGEAAPLSYPPNVQSGIFGQNQR